MSLRKVVGLLIVIVALGVGAIVMRTELIGRAPPIDISKPAGSASSTALRQQERAEKKSEQEAIKANCVALRKMDAINKNCPPK